MVYCFGETVIDVIFRGEGCVTAVPGGSMFNTAVSLGRCGVPVALISECGSDPAGELAAEYLSANGVATRWLARFENGKTAIALAVLDSAKDARYSFYKDYPAFPQFSKLPPTGPGDIILFGSSYALADRSHETVYGFVHAAKAAGSLVIYDPNYRRPASETTPALRERALLNIGMARIVRGSDEDFRNLFGASDAEEAFNIIRNTGCGCLIYTMNRNGVEVITGNFRQQYPVPPIHPVSTVGAGDAFTAGLISQFAAQGPGLPACESQWNDAIASGILFATEVCLSTENAISNRRTVG